MKSKIINLSQEPLGKVISWLPPELDAERIVFFPDACPGKSPLPTGTAVLTRQPDWRKFAVSDCGCGMRLVKSNLLPGDIRLGLWDQIAGALRRNKGKLGDLGGGNHFLDAIVSVSGGPVHFLIHTGSRAESGHVDGFVEQPARFDLEFRRVEDWARRNRERVQETISEVVGEVDLVSDLAHNTFQSQPDGAVLIRKGTQSFTPGVKAVIPSHMGGEVVLAEPVGQSNTLLCSINHGTGRSMSRAESKQHAEGFDFEALRARVLLPSGLTNASLRTEGPYAYRDLDECLETISDFIKIVDRFKVIAYMGRL